MRKTKTTFEQSTTQYNEYFGKCPTDTEITSLYYEYCKNWEQYDGFTDWLVYYTA